MGRPRCEKCGKRIYQYRKPYRINLMGVPLIKPKAPLHCQNCGAELSPEKVSQVYGHDDSIFLGVCFGSIIFIVVVLVITFTVFGDKII